MAKEGSKCGEIKGIDDIRLITAVLCVTKCGHFLAPQIIYKGKTKRCLPKVSFPKSWDVTYTENHWSNETTTLQYIQLVLLPYVTQKRAELMLPSSQPALVIFERFKAQCTSTVLQVLRENNICTCFVSTCKLH